MYINFYYIIYIFFLISFLFPLVVPPTHITILDTNGAAIRDHTVGPYSEGTSINLTCLSSGGKPAPRVTWYREHELVDDTYETLPDGTVRNVLHLHRVLRKDLMAVSKRINFLSYFSFWFCAC